MLKYAKIDTHDLELLLVSRLHIVTKLQDNLMFHLNLECSAIHISWCILLHIRVLALFPELDSRI